MKHDTTLRLDIDRATCPPVRRLCRVLARAGYRVAAIGYRRSPSGKGWHVWIVTTPKPPSLEVVAALQAICGSDPWREAMVLYRAERATTPILRKMVNVLYAPCAERRKGVKRVGRNATGRRHDGI